MKTKQHQQTVYLLAILAILAGWSLLLIEDESYNNAATSISTTVYNDEDISRSLRYSHYIRPNSSIASLRSASNDGTTSTITIYLAGNISESDIIDHGGGKYENLNPAQSIFKTDIFQRYGSGRFDFEIVPYAPCDYSCANVGITTNNGGPCLAVGRVTTYKMPYSCPINSLQCTYPKCKTMVTNDEHCDWGNVDVRQYYSSDFHNKGYLPLGPRLDTWTSFQNIIQSDPNFYIKPASERKFAFNAIFSESTNQGRRSLRWLIDYRQPTSNLTIYERIAKVWTADVNSESTAQANTNEYMHVLLESVFTLSPTGHNPECFRLFEAIEAGSIPVVTMADLHGGGFGYSRGGATSWGGRGSKGNRLHLSRCRGSLKDWYDAPILVLNTWNDLYPTVTKLMNDLDKLNEMQRELRVWYDGYMGRVIEEFEDYMVGDLYKDK